MMMQMQATMLDLMPTVAKSNSNTGALKVGSTDSSLRFDQLLSQAGTSLVPICQERGLVATADGEAGLVNEQEEELVRKDFGMLAALLAQPSLIMLASRLRGQNDEVVAVTSKHALAAELPERVPRSAITEHISTQAQAGRALADSLLPQLLTNADEVAGMQAETVSVSQQGVLIVEAGSLVELLEQLQADTPQVLFDRPVDVRPERWGQLERYWLLRESHEAEPEPEPELQQIAPDLELDSAGMVVVAEKGLPLRAATEFITKEVDLPAVSALAADEIGQPEESEQSSQFAAYLDIGVDNVAISEIAEPAEISYVARPGTPLEQQLEQGLAVGLRQLRLLRSPESITVRMQLYPESLGEVRVELKMSGNMLTAQLRTLQPQATEALRLELPLLRENLVNQGFTHVFLGAETAEHFGHSAGRERQRFQEERARHPQRVGIVKTETREELEQEQLTRGLDYRL